MGLCTPCRSEAKTRIDDRFEDQRAARGRRCRRAVTDVLDRPCSRRTALGAFVMSGQTKAPAGWYPDPEDRRRLRFWDGRSWVGPSPGERAQEASPAAVRRSVPGAEGSSTLAGVPEPWWRTWPVIVVTLLFCLPVGLVGLWLRRGTSTAVKSAVTGAVALLLVLGALTAGDTDTTTSVVPAQGPTDKPPPAASSVPSAPASGSVPPSSSPSASPSPRAPSASRLAKVPALKGIGLTDAKRALGAAGLKVGEINGRPSGKKKGTVLEQGAPEGKRLKPGSRVQLVVAKPFPKVPSVLGDGKTSAVRTLKEAGFKVKTTIRTRTSGEDNVVLSQSPSEGTRARPNSRIRIVVSNVEPPPDEEEDGNCTPGYSPCLPPAFDYDCAGGSGNGPEYVDEPVHVAGLDPYDLDRDRDGIGCDT